MTAQGSLRTDRRFWRRHALWPGLLFLVAAALAATTGFDEAVARAWAFDPVAGQFIGSGPGAWWAKDLIHAKGGLLIRGFGGLILLIWALSFRMDSLRRFRRPAGYVVLSAALGAGAVGLLKLVTNVDCPWSLADFGGTVPYSHLFADRLDSLPRAQCFPGGHSSSGFALFTLYFVALGRHGTVARWALAGALLVGGVFAFGQEARGAHFLSHDLWSAALVWFACLVVYVVGYRGNVWERGDMPNLALQDQDRLNPAAPN
ncbi:MAG: phosphatase PAP2 family protein [Gammaproteobacteria bacterium]